MSKQDQDIAYMSAHDGGFGDPSDAIEQVLARVENPRPVRDRNVVVVLLYSGTEY